MEVIVMKTIKYGLLAILCSGGIISAGGFFGFYHAPRPVYVPVMHHYPVYMAPAAHYPIRFCDGTKRPGGCPHGKKHMHRHAHRHVYSPRMHMNVGFNTGFFGLNIGF